MTMNCDELGVVLSGFSEDDVSSDQITLIGGADGQRVAINRTLLMASSRYFAAALGPNFDGSDESEIVFDETDGATLRAIVSFCQTGLVDFTEDNVLKVLAVSDSIELDSLHAKCWPFVIEKRFTMDALATFVAADRYNHPKIRQKAFDLICGTFKTFPTLNINGMHWRLVRELLENDNLRATETHIFDRLLEWFRGDQTNREQHMAELLKLIRLESLPTQFLNEGKLEGIYKQFNCFESILAERQTRTECGKDCLNDGRRRPRSIFTLNKTEKSDAVYIDRYNSASKKFEFVAKKYVGDRKEYEVQLHENELYVIGGFIGNVIQKSLLMFDLNTKRIEALPDMNKARTSFASVTLGKYIYVFGGASWLHWGSSERFDMETLTWAELKPMNTSRCKARATVLGRHIYVFGGYCDTTDEYCNIIEMYDPDSDEWHELLQTHSPYTETLFKSNLVLHSIGVDTDWRQSIVERYDAAENCWTKIRFFPRICIKCSVEIADGIFIIESDRKNRFYHFGQLDWEKRGSFVSLARPKHMRFRELPQFFRDCDLTLD